MIKKCNTNLCTRPPEAIKDIVNFFVEVDHNQQNFNQIY